MTVLVAAALTFAGLYGNARANRTVRIRTAVHFAHHQRLLAAGRYGEALGVARSSVPTTGPLVLSAASTVAVGGGLYLALTTVMGLIA